jgi:hypothetical protein
MESLLERWEASYIELKMEILYAQRSCVRVYISFLFILFYFKFSIQVNFIQNLNFSLLSPFSFFPHNLLFKSLKSFHIYSINQLH